MASLSVVTICFNNLTDLITTISSVKSQDRPPDEYWIIDGSTNKEINDYLSQADLPSYVRWVYERDKGISDAFNKGITKCTKDIIHILNSGDYYFGSKVISTAMNSFKDSRVMWIHGKYKQFLGGQWIVSGKPFNPKKLYLGMREVAHPTMFVRREVYDRIGLFPSDLRDAMDYDFLVRLRNEPYLYVEEILTVFTPGGNSEIHWRRCFKEGMKAYKRHLGYDPRVWVGYSKQLLIHAVLSLPIGQWLIRKRKV
ncbi:MAG: glycosyltransferase [Bacteroidetes bacterium]|nr:glycosyltransferase [Bacteroidota bacterium]